MRRTGTCLVIVAALAPIFSLAASAAQEPKNAINGILNLFPGYHVLTLAERNAETRAFVLRRFPKDNPSIVNADINGDGSLDYALLLKDDKSNHTKLVVLLCSRDNPCKKVFELDVTGYSGTAYLRPVSSGSKVPRTDGIDENAHSGPATVSATGIRVTYFEKGEVVYYWNEKHGKLEAVQTKD
jgi:hypothetical protein